jgi:hypothetical protein
MQANSRDIKEATERAVNAINIPDFISSTVTKK